MAAAASSHHRPWVQLAAATSASRRRSIGRPIASAPPVRTLVCAVRTGALPLSRTRRRAVAARASAAEEARPSSSSSSSPDAVTYSSSIDTDMPLYEPPGISRLLPYIDLRIGNLGRVSFDEYLLDRPRVFRSMFPDESRSQRLSDEEWRIQMLPLEFLLLTVNPVVVMQLRNRGGVLELRITEWELRGLDSGYTPASFDLGVRDSLYADRGTGRGCRLRGHLEISITVVLPPPLRLVPEGVLRGVAESVLSSLAEKMKRDVDVGLVADFWRFRLEKAASRAAGAVVARADREA